MYVRAPRRTTNGTTQESRAVLLRSDPTRYPTLAEAQLRADQLTYTSSSLEGERIRENMQKGINQWKEYRNTQYRTVANYFSTQGRVKTINLNAPYGYQPMSNSFVWRGDTAQFGNGLVQRASADLSLVSGSSAEWYLNNGVMTNLLNRAKAECLVKAKAKTLDLSEVLVDLPRTVGMVADRLIQVMLAWKHLRKGDLYAAAIVLELPNFGGKRHRRKVKNLSDLWLELQYGWMPLMSDIHNGVGLVNDLLKGSKPKGHYTAVRRLSTPLLIRPPDYSSSDWLDAKRSAIANGYVEVRYRWVIQDSTVAFLDALGLQNPLYVAWIQVPFSFVVDWAIPVSTWLEAISAPLGLQFTSGYETRKTWARSEVEASQRSVGVYSKAFESGSVTAIHERLEMRREVLYNFPIAVPYIRFPFSSPERIATAISLVTQSRKLR